MRTVALIKGLLRLLWVVVLLNGLLIAPPFPHHAVAGELTPIPELMTIINGPANKVHISERFVAIQEIGRHGTKEAAEVLTGLLKGDTKFMAALSLRSIKDQRAVPLLVAHLNGQDSFTRDCLCETIGALGGDAAVQALRDVALNDGDIYVRRMAVHALRTDADDRPDGPAMGTLLELLEIQELAAEVADVLFELRNDQAISRLHPALQNENPTIRALICEVIKRHRHGDSTDPLIALLNREKNEAVLGKAIVALAAVHPPARANEVAAVLQKFLKSEELRETTVKALGNTVSRADHLDTRLTATLGKLLLPVLESQNGGMRHTAVNIYKELRFGPAAPKLMQLIRKEADSYIREAALAALAVSLEKKDQVEFLFDWRQKHPDDDAMVKNAVMLIDNPVTAPRLIGELKDDDTSLLYAVIPTLARLGDNAAAQPLLDRIAASKEPCEEAALALKQVAGEKDLARLAAILKEEPCAKTQLGRTLVHLDRQYGFKQIRTYIHSNQKQDVAALFTALDHWHTLPMDAEVLIEALGIEDFSIRQMAVEALAHIEDPKVTDAVCTAFARDKEGAVRTVAATALGAMGSAAAITCLVDGYALTSKDPNLITLNEATLSALRTATGQELDTADQWQSWVQDHKGLGRDIEGCIDALKSDNDAERLLAARQIATWPDAKARRKALPAALEQMGKHVGTHEEKIAEAQILSGVKDSASRDIMLTVCEQSSELRVRAALAKALYLSVDARGVAKLVQCLEDAEQCRGDDPIEVLEAIALATDRPLNYQVDSWKQWWRKQSTILSKI
ncbi:MAG: HEAT repeat domain-containing protein [Desulfatitalea sp.]